MAIKFSIPALIGLGLSTVFGQPDSLRWGELEFRLMTDFGHIIEGDYGGNEFENQPLNRNIVVLEQAANYGKWNFDAGFKAIMWWPFPPGLEPAFRTIRVEPRLSQVKAQRNFGNAAYLEFGFFPYKYNPDAQNLGEYLYRSGTYPGVVRTTDGFNLQDYAVYEAYGGHFRYAQAGGRVTHDFNVFAEQTAVPTGDLTPAYEISVNLPIVQFGAGAAYNRFITYNSRRVEPHVSKNGYFRVDSVGGSGTEYVGVEGMAPTAVKARIVEGDSTVHALHYYTQRGVKLMARAAVDLGFLLPEDRRSPGDLRFFTEVALLGVENQPYYYDDRARRMPVMFGVNLPTFRWLDLLSVQGEYYANRFGSNTDFDFFATPVWTVSASDTTSFNNRRDDWKWSVHARKQVNRLLTVHAQVANDHIRLTSFDLNPSGSDLTKTPSQWYYLLRLECRL